MRTKYPLGPIYLVNFIATMGFSIVFPFMVFLNMEFGGDSFLFGLMLAMYSLFQIPGGIIFGRLSDRIGRKKVLIASHMGTVLSWCLYVLALLAPLIPLFSVKSEFVAFTLTLPLLLLFAARGFDGLTGGNIAVANAYLADVSSKSELTARLGRNSLAADFGFVIGPVIGGTLGSVLSGTEAQRAILPVMTALALSLAAVFLLLRLRESPLFSKTGRIACALREKAAPRISEVLAVRGVRYPLVMFFALIFTLGLFITVMPLHTQIDLGWSALTLSAFFVVMGISLMAAEGPITSRLSRKISDKKISVLGLGLLFLGYVLFASGDDMLGYFLAAVPFSMGLALAATGMHAYVTKLVHERMQGTLQGVVATTDAAGAVTGLVLGGILFGIIGSYGVYAVLAVISAFLIFAAALVLKNDG